VSVQSLAVEHRRRRQAITGTVARAAVAAWRAVDPADVDRSWQAGVQGPVLEAVIVGQLAAASLAQMYVDAQVREQGAVITGPRLVPRAFAGTASDGRDLVSLLHQPVIAAKARIGQGDTPVEALRVAGHQLAKIVVTQITDAGRVPVGVAAVANRNVTGYVRVLTPPSCARCAILAGRVYRVNEGFARHPRCDCTHAPLAGADADQHTVDPRAYFDSLDPAEQNRVFTRAGAQAIRDGADIGRVVNARRGMATTVNATGARRQTTARVFGRSVFTTTEATTVRGAFGRQAAAEGQAARSPGQRYRRATGTRLMPEQIYLEAGDDRAEAIRLLTRHGYLR
jgi:hypothetical protein